MTTLRAGSSARQWVPHRKRREAREVPIRAPQLVRAMVQTEGRDAAVMHLRAGDLSQRGAAGSFLNYDVSPKDGEFVYVASDSTAVNARPTFTWVQNWPEIARKLGGGG